MDNDNNLVQKNEQAVLWAAETEGDIIAHKCTMKVFHFPCPAFSGSYGSAVTVVSESLLNISTQLPKHKV